MINIAKHIQMTKAFHLKNEFQVGVCSQIEMFERNNLLLEELGELQTEILAHNNELIKTEAIDVYYILMGNLVAFGFEDLNEITIEEFNFSKLLFCSSKLAQATRKRFENDYLIEFINLHQQMIGLIHGLFANQIEFDQYYKSSHEKSMNKKRRKIGDTYVVSNFNQN